jgi:hypothetical protein
MLDSDLASMYGVETKSLNRAVKRNADRFQRDFMFQISADEWQNLKYQIGTLKSGRKNERNLCADKPPSPDYNKHRERIRDH